MQYAGEHITRTGMRTAGGFGIEVHVAGSTVPRFGLGITGTADGLPPIQSKNLVGLTERPLSYKRIRHLARGILVYGQHLLFARLRGLAVTGHGNPPKWLRTCQLQPAPHLLVDRSSQSSAR